MKRRKSKSWLGRAILTAWTMAVFSGCQSLSPSTENGVRIEFQEGYDNQPVRVSVDGHPFFSKTVTSDPALGLAMGISYKTKKTVVPIRVQMPNEAVDETFSLNLRRGKNFGLNFSSGKLILSQSMTPYLYD